MLRRTSAFATSFKLTVTVSAQRHFHGSTKASVFRQPRHRTFCFLRRSYPSSCSVGRGFSSKGTVQAVTWAPELTRSAAATVVEGCDYEHWLVVMDPPTGYPQRDQIIRGYVETLALVLASEEVAKKSMYSVSTKYYYAFGCRIQKDVAHRIKSLPYVRWVLPDSYLSLDEKEYGGEPVIDGEVVPYNDKYHSEWLRE